MTKTKKTCYGLILAIAFGLSGQSLIAMGEKNLAQIYFVTAKAGHEADLYEKIKEHAEWRKEAGDPWSWSVYQTVTGSELGQYIIRSGNHSWSCWDAYEEFNAKGSAEWNEHVAPYIASVSSIIMSDHDTLQDWPTDHGETNFLDITWYDLKPGKMAEFFGAAEMYHKVIQENDYDVHYSFGQVVSGASGNRVVLAIPFANYSAMEGPEEEMSDFFKRVMDEESFMEAGEKWGGSYEYAEGYIIRFHPELSVLPDPED